MTVKAFREAVLAGDREWLDERTRLGVRKEICTAIWSGVEACDLYINGNRIGNPGDPVFERHAEGGRKLEVSNIVLHAGDVIALAGWTKGSAMGVTCVLKNGEGEVLWCSDDTRWKAFVPKEADAWFHPEIIFQSQAAPAVALPEGFGVQTKIIQSHSKTVPVKPIWRPESTDTGKQGYFYSVFE